MRSNPEMVAEALEVLVEVEDVDASVLSSGGNRQIGKRKAMGSM